MLSNILRSSRPALVHGRVMFSVPSTRSAGATMIRFNSTGAKSSEKVTDATAENTTAEPESAAVPEVELTAEQQEIATLKEKIQKKDKDLADMKNHYARAVADFRNLQESTRKEVQKSKDFALQKFAKDLLESLDNFALALQSVKEDTLKANEEVKNLYDGVNMTRNVFEKTLHRHGIQKIDPIGEVFDPNLHEAAFEIPHPEQAPGTVMHVQQLGYTLNSRVLRPAKVGLVKDNN
ncbi:Mitochondrial matrix cochaperone [Scheffersomyces spartinae]|uniref:GrpE protein homolog, mitochondrial n=1 Tax=Scheffersomyces spartinae TaxID=45513 RepID=A0A9P8AHW2_9ASCO|nr:Mitochondrial matrix cochaperone [Scheffersomyces spartinae]KAG7192927.1 Mitochondrial matrix cochaperone [Scheffersomyces spartinae]